MYDVKEYRRVATAIADELEAVAGYSDRRIIQASLISLAERLVKTYSAVNANFKESRFMDAAGLVWSPGTKTWEVSTMYGGTGAVHVMNDNEPDRLGDLARKAY